MMSHSSNGIEHLITNVENTRIINQDYKQNKPCVQKKNTWSGFGLSTEGVDNART
jgi:hypothetical protein